MISRLREHPRTFVVLMLILTVGTGIIDAVGYLGLDRVFTGNMTGNVVILGMGLAGADDLPVAGPLVALGCFMAGAAGAGRAVRGRAPGSGWSARHTVVMAAVAAVLAASGAVALTVEDPSPAVVKAITGALGFAMGCQAGAARHLAITDLTTVVITSTLTGLAADSVLGQGTGQPWLRRTAAIVLIAVGAALGAVLLRVHAGWGMVCVAALTAAVAAVGHVVRPVRD